MIKENDGAETRALSIEQALGEDNRHKPSVLQPAWAPPLGSRHRTEARISCLLGTAICERHAFRTSYQGSQSFSTSAWAENVPKELNAAHYCHFRNYFSNLII